MANTINAAAAGNPSALRQAAERATNPAESSQERRSQTGSPVRNRTNPGNDRGVAAGDIGRGVGTVEGRGGLDQVPNTGSTENITSNRTGRPAGTNQTPIADRTGRGLELNEGRNQLVLNAENVEENENLANLSDRIRQNRGQQEFQQTTAGSIDRPLGSPQTAGTLLDQRV